MKYVTQPGRYRAYVERPTTGGWLSQTDNGAEFVRIPLVIDHEDPTQGGCQITWNGFLNTDKVIDRTTRMLMLLIDDEMAEELLCRRVEPAPKSECLVGFSQPTGRLFVPEKVVA